MIQINFLHGIALKFFYQNIDLCKMFVYAARVFPGDGVFAAAAGHDLQ